MANPAAITPAITRGSDSAVDWPVSSIWGQAAAISNPPRLSAVP